MNNTEKQKALEALLQQKVALSQALEKQRNEVILEIVKTQGKLELLQEFAHESAAVSPVAKKEENLESTQI